MIVIRRLEGVPPAWREARQAGIRAKKPKITATDFDARVKKLEQNSAVSMQSIYSIASLLSMTNRFENPPLTQCPIRNDPVFAPQPAA